MTAPYNWQAAQHTCDICGEQPADGFDESDGTQWCLECMLAWDKRTGCYWATGQPRTDTPWDEL